MSAFNDHLDACPQCRENPFDLCPTGGRLLVAAATKVDPIDDPEHVLAIAKHWHERAAASARSATHWEGCELEHSGCALWILSRAIILGERSA